MDVSQYLYTGKKFNPKHKQNHRKLLWVKTLWLSHEKTADVYPKKNEMS